MKKYLSIYLLCFAFILSFAPAKAHQIVVAADGSGKFKSIQEAINSLPDASASQHIIFVKKGTYREKLFIAKNNILIKGEKSPRLGGKWTDTEGVKIIYSEAREIFRCNTPDDWGAGVVNIKAQDITLENLIVVNDFGFNAKGDSVFICNGQSKVTRKDGHQFALRCMPLTQRLKVINCNFHSLGGDTVSPWDVDNGTFYFKNCTMEGGVDLYCPRGWAYAENCYFICHNKSAAIWHDGTGNESAKTVLKNCQFVGDDGYKLGRFHRDAQFYLINCTFSNNMADAPIYKNSKDTVLQWETRVYYYNCHKKGGDYAWHKNNITAATAQKINWNWTLKKRWNMKPQPPKTKSDYGLPKVADAPAPKNQQDDVANRMLIAQRNAGGWAKTLDGKTQPPPYDKTWDATLIAAIGDDAGRNDATIDNNATTREIRHLATAFVQNGQEKYKVAAEKGIDYLLKMQYDNGGFPQFFPDTSGYRKHITFNDNAMIKALQILKEVAAGQSPFDKVGNSYREKAKTAVEKGVDCILKTQIQVNGESTIWCAQHHYQTFEPVKARAYELPSFSGNESVGILEFLMKIDNPTPSVKKAIVSGVAFLEKIQLSGIRTERIKDTQLTTGEDVIVVADARATPLWARFYDLETQKPFFSGRDGIKKNTLAEIENERRAHYGWYGDWPLKLITKEYPKWVAKWGK